MSKVDDHGCIKAPTVRFVATIAVAACLVTVPARGEQSIDGTSVFAAVRAGVVAVSSGSKGLVERTGSGVIVGPNEILSNCHVIQGSSELTVEFSDGERAKAIAGLRVAGSDLCTLVVATGRRRPIVIAPIGSLKIGQKVFALGNPMSLTATFSDGLISGLRKHDGIVAIQTTAPISPGSSGGGLFDSIGRLLGITTFTMVRGQNLNFALPAEYLRTLPLELPSSGATEAANLTFKGVPFGASVESFKASFQDAECRASIGRMTVCDGGVSYLGRGGSYSARFNFGRLSSVSFHWARPVLGGKLQPDGRWIYEYGEGISAIQDDVRNTLSGRFGEPAKQTKGVGGTLEWTVGEYQSIVLSIADCTNPITGLLNHCRIIEQERLVELLLSDKRFLGDGSPTRDF